MANFKGFVGLTRAQYDALATKDPQKMYMITDEPPYEKPAGGIPASDMASAVQASLAKADSAIPASQKGAAGGVAELDSGGKVPSAQLPSYVDDVLEYASTSAFPATGEAGKIYIATDTNKTYRWSGSAYVEISASLALGETSSTAYRGDRGKTAYDHSQDATVHVTAADKSAWGGKYEKPSGGIPASDLASGVIPDVSGKENTSNKVTSISSASTDAQYPSAKCVYDIVGNIESLLEGVL